MKANLGSVDRVVRVIIAAIIAILYLAGEISGTAAIILLAIAAIFIATSLMKFCPIYFTFGLSSRKEKTTGDAK